MHETIRVTDIDAKTINNTCHWDGGVKIQHKASASAFATHPKVESASVAVCCLIECRLCGLPACPDVPAHIKRGSDLAARAAYVKQAEHWLLCSAVLWLRVPPYTIRCKAVVLSGWCARMFLSVCVLLPIWLAGFGLMVCGVADARIAVDTTTHNVMCRRSSRCTKNADVSGCQTRAAKS